MWHLARALTERGHHVSVFAAPGSDPDVGCTPLAAVRDLTLSPVASSRYVHARGGIHDRPPRIPHVDAHTRPLDRVRSHPQSQPSSFADRDGSHAFHSYVDHGAYSADSLWPESALTVTRATGTELAAVSEHTAAAWRTIASRITVVPNGIDIDRWPLGPGGAYLVWFGRITPEKAPHMAIAAAQRARMPLVVAGPISDPPYFADQVAPHLDKDIRYAGHLNQTESGPPRRRCRRGPCDADVDEPYGLVVAEAMSCGTPVVAFARGGVPELVGDTGGQLVPPADIAGMAQAIPAAIGLPRTQVRCHAVRRCSLDSMLAAYLTRYRQMIDEVSDGTDDRVLHPPPRLRPPGASRQHRHSDEQASYSADFAGHLFLAAHPFAAVVKLPRDDDLGAAQRTHCLRCAALGAVGRPRLHRQNERGRAVGGRHPPRSGGHRRVGGNRGLHATDGGASHRDDTARETNRCSSSRSCIASPITSWPRGRSNCAHHCGCGNTRQRRATSGLSRFDGREIVCAATSAPTKSSPLKVLVLSGRCDTFADAAIKATARTCPSSTWTVMGWHHFVVGNGPLASDLRRARCRHPRRSELHR